ncbi:YkgJ family cysteine cluster protein [Paraburkholderia rhizosphaerae]|uniref:Putative zinc-or iron-chelating protein n=1 Tax=Paraburkholderia rhizosphaerae TaxID=480658 RepID=A0A4R8L467_9BURK|nr:YkgJ family cysteine cluster protein [Paraburkholderia rhizosphaerae]TDY37382.1 putative zinc- or iron-chelating protein [Paraburkholderia rhizosphaerae]
MTIHFSCTQCGKCCHNLRLPLSLDEAADWIRRGGDIELFCEAIPWPVEPPQSDAQAAHKRRLSFAAMCGAVPIRVIVTVVAAFDGACPHLLHDGRCGAYGQRPRVCRIYPAEVNPFIHLTPASKACPPDAWTTDKPVFFANGQTLDSETSELISQSRAVAAQDAQLKERLCAYLDVHHMALANEGFAIHKRAPDVMLAALERLKHDRKQVAHGAAATWRFVSNRLSTVDTLVSIGADTAEVSSLPNALVSYIAFFPSDV